MKYPIKCRISNEGQSTRVDVYDDIGGGLFGGGISASDFTGALASVRGALDVHINSGGGVVWDGITIANAIRNHQGRVTTVVDGLAASIASVIAQAGHERVVQPGSMLMIHDAYSAVEGNAAEMAKMADTLEQVSNNLAGIYAKAAGGSAAVWRDRMRAETWYSADEAVAAGLADRVAGVGASLPQGFDLAAYHLPSQIAASLRTLPVVAAAAAEASCAELGHQCCRDAAVTRDALRSLIREEIRAAGPEMHNGHPRWDPDGDGDCDACPEGDTDHDYFNADGEPIQPQPGNHAPAAILGRDFSQDDRDRLAASGAAMPDGSYPIENEEDLHNAIHAVGRGGADHDAIRRHIIKRAAALGQSGAIPDNWNSDGSMKTSAGNSLAAQFLAMVAGHGQLDAGKE